MFTCGTWWCVYVYLKIVKKEKDMRENYISPSKVRTLHSYVLFILAPTVPLPRREILTFAMPMQNQIECPESEISTPLLSPSQLLSVFYPLNLSLSPSAYIA